MKITALVADDEEAPRAQIAGALARLWPELHVVASCANGIDAWDEFLACEPQVCFLDIRMPGLDGLEVARRMAAVTTPPHVVLVTAFGDHALTAFDAGAVDYLLKPVEDSRLVQTVKRLRASLASPATAALRAVLEGMAGGPRRAMRPIQAGVGREVRFIAPDEVFYFESDSRYTRVVHDGGEALVRTPLKELLASLDPETFWQVHRSLLVNSRRIASAIRVDDHAMVITLKGCDARLPVSRQFQVLFRAH